VNIIVGGAYILTASDGFIEHLSLLHLLLASFSFLCMIFAALITRNSIHFSSSNESEE